MSYTNTQDYIQIEKDKNIDKEQKEKVRIVNSIEQLRFLFKDLQKRIEKLEDRVDYQANVNPIIR